MEKQEGKSALSPERILLLLLQIFPRVGQLVISN